MQDYLINNGLPALFLLSFLASTLLPLGSEWLLVILIIHGHSMAGVVTIATIGNYLGACTTYMIGLWGSQFLITKILHINDKDMARAHALYGKYGSWSLLLSWLPVVGDPLCLLGGIFKIHFFRYSMLVFSGKLARYIAVALLTSINIH
jgi:membrane protein YqaA with SNARE-associated domain